MTEKQDPEYLLGATQREVERLQKQHAWFKTCLNNKIVFAPVDLQKPGLKVLDVGCADGALLRDLQAQVSPSAQLVGVDLMSIFLPDSPQGNISFAVGDVGEPPVRERTAAFDLTHVRYVIAGAAQAGLGKVIQNLADTLAPGGWLQIQEMDSRPDPNQCQSWNDLNGVLGTIFEKNGFGRADATKLDESFKKAGLTNVTTEVIKLPAGKKLGNEQDAMNSLIPFKITIPTLRQAAQGLKLDLPESTFDGLEERFEKEMMEEGAVFTSVVVCGQKPN